MGHGLHYQYSMLRDFILLLLLLPLVSATITMIRLDQKRHDRYRRNITVFEKSKYFLCLVNLGFFTTNILLPPYFKNK